MQLSLLTLALTKIFSGGGAGSSLNLDMTSGNNTLDPRITFTRDSNATLTNSAGLIAYAPHNLLSYSEQFDNAAWNQNASIVITANAGIAPNGTQTADQLSGSLVNTGVWRIPSVTAGVPHVYSLYVKNVSNASVLRIGCDANPVNAFITFNAVSGTITSSAANVTSSAVSNEGNGWYRVSIGFTPTTTASGFVIYSTSGSAATWHVWGAQLNVGALQPYYPTTSAAYYGPRFDYDPITLQPKGLLIEEQRTNLITYSEQFDNAAWAKSNATITADATNAPNGTLTADKFETSGGGASYLYQGKTLTQGLAYTLSVYVKNSSGSNIVWLRDFTEAGVAQFDIANGTVYSVATGIASSPQIVACGNGWYRISAVFTPTIATGNHNLSCVHPSSALVGNAFYAWGAQLEAGAFPTSYIPTTSAQVTRAADVATMTGTNFSSWYNQTEGTLFSEHQVPSVTSRYPNALNVNDGTASNYMSLGFGPTANTVRFERTASGVASSSLNPAVTASSGQFVKEAVAYSANDFAVVGNGGSAYTSSSGAIPKVNQLRIGGYVVGNSAQLNGTIKRIAYYPRRLSNSELQSITS